MSTDRIREAREALDAWESWSVVSGGLDQFEAALAAAARSFVEGEPIEWCEEHGSRFARELPTMAQGFQNHCMYACHERVDGCSIVSRWLSERPAVHLPLGDEG